MAKQKIPKLVRELVGARANHLCEYCKSQERFAPQSFTIDHAIPLSKKGGSEPTNLVYACQGCNGYKKDFTGGLDQITKHFAKIYDPRVAAWEEHFCWSEDFSEIIGMTPTGRVTVSKLRLNRKILVEFRKFLSKYGEHPPV